MMLQYHNGKNYMKKKTYIIQPKSILLTYLNFLLNIVNLRLRLLKQQI